MKTDEQRDIEKVSLNPNWKGMVWLVVVLVIINILFLLRAIGGH